MPVEQPPLVPGAGPRPFWTRDDVVARLDALLQDGDVAPIRDALIDALTSLIFELQFRSEYAIAQADLLRATAGYLTSLGGDDRGISRVQDEQDLQYRARILTVPASVTEEAIVLGVNILLAPFTSTECQLIDGALDRLFIGATNSPAAQWRSFIGAPPEYPDRLFANQEASNGGISRPNSDPGGARIFGDQNGRRFVLYLPDLTGLAQPSSVWDATSRPNDAGFYVGDTSNPDVLGLVGSQNADAATVYRAIEGFVNSVVGQSIRWGFFAELEAV